MFIVWLLFRSSMAQKERALLRSRRGCLFAATNYGREAYLDRLKTVRELQKWHRGVPLTALLGRFRPVSMESGGVLCVHDGKLTR